MDITAIILLKINYKYFKAWITQVEITMTWVNWWQWLVLSSSQKKAKVPGTKLILLCLDSEFKEIKQTQKDNSTSKMVIMKIGLYTLMCAIVEVIIKEAKIIGQTKIQQWIEKVVKFLSIWVPAPKLPSNCIQFNPIRIIIPRIIMEAINIVDRWWIRLIWSA